MLPIAAALPEQTQVPAHFSTGVEQVVLPVTVSDRHGRQVPGIAGDRFRVFDDGQPQQIEKVAEQDIPLTAGIIVDSSGSMEPKREDAVLAALHFARLSNPEDEIFVINFDEKVRFGLPEGEPFTAKPSELRSALLSQCCVGKTALYDAVAAGLEHLDRGSRDKKALIVISDGGDNASHRSFDSTLDIARKSNAMIYTIGLFDEADPDRNPKVLRKLAQATGGECYLPGQPSELGGICARIAGELRNQYSVAYKPADAAHDGRYHRIRVAIVGSDKYEVRTREGYWAPQPDTKPKAE